MTDKQLKILVTVDEQAVRRSMQFVERLTSMARKSIEEVSRAQNMLIGMGGSGGRGAMSGGAFLSARPGATPQNITQQSQLGGVGQRLTQSLADQSTIFRAISQGSKDTLRAMSDELRRNLAMQRMELKSMGDTVDTLSKKYVTLQERAQSFARSGAHDVAASLGLSAKETLHDSLSMMAAKEEKAALVSSLEKSLAKLTEARIGGPFPPVPPGLPGSLVDDSGRSEKPRLAAADVALIASSIGRAVAGAVSGVGGFVQSGKLLQEQNAATVAQALPGRFLNRMLQGDVRDLYFMRHMRGVNGGTFGADFGGAWEGTGAATLQLAGQALEGATQAGAGIATLGRGGAGKGGGGIQRTAGDVAGAGSGIAGGILGTAGAIRNIFGGRPQAVEAATMGEGLDLAHAMNPLTTAAFDVLAAERGIRASSSRRLMGMHMGARGVGAGYGYDFGQSTGIAESLQRLGGMSGMFGTGGKRTLIGGAQIDANTAHRIYEQAARGELGMDAAMNLPQLREKLMEMSSPQYRTTGGTRGLLQASMQLAGHGIDMGVGQSALTGIFQASRGAGGTPESTMQALERAVERGTSKGFTDPRVKEEIIGAMGRAAAGAIISSTTGVERLGAFLTAGGSGDMSLAQTQGRVAALAGLDGLSSGNAFFQGVNIASAKGVLGPGASPLALMALGGATESQLLTGGRAFDVHGISESQRLEQLRASVGSKAQAYMNLLSPEEQARYQSGGFSALGADSTFKLLRSMKSFGNDQTAQGLAEIITGGDLGALGGTSGKRLKQFADGLAVASISMEEQTKARLMGEEMAKHVMQLFKQFTPGKMLEQIAEFQKQQDEFDFSKGKVFAVKVLKELNEQPPTPQNPRKRE
jgi:hypothetical protein